MKKHSLFRFIAMACGILAALYFAAFVSRFEVLGSPVRNDAYGWLGPAMRGGSYIDVGKVYYYEGTDFSSYRVFRPLCFVWLRVMGI